MRIVSILLILVVQLTAHAQDNNQVRRVRNGSDMTKTIPYAERFQYDVFKDGKVFFRNGNIVKAKLNYSLPHGEVQFVDARKDTMILTDKVFISKITIEADTFYYFEKHGHVRKLMNFNNVTLAEKQFIAQLDSERNSAYEQYTSTSAISVYSSYTNSRGLQQPLEGNDKVLLKRRVVHILIDRNQNAFLATKANLLRLFPKHKRSISQYLKDNDNEFVELKDINAALTYASNL
jgi:hypothetical protein